MTTRSYGSKRPSHKEAGGLSTVPPNDEPKINRKNPIVPFEEADE